MKKLNISILTFVINTAGCTSLSNLVEILYPISNDLHLITGNDGYMFFKNDKRIHTFGMRHEAGANVFTRMIRYIYAQLKISYKLAKISRNVDVWIFTIGGEGLVLPMLIARVWRKKVVLVLVDFPTKTSQAQKDPLSKITSFLSKISFILSNRIVAYSNRIVEERGLEKYRNKISIAHEHFLDFDKFKIKKKFGERDNLVGYIGRLSEEKGTLNFVKSIPLILKQRDDLKFLICGDGPLRDKIEKYLDKENLNDKVKRPGWIPHDELPDHLNELKLLVLPSYTEGLPNIMLEAMACGTPVLATPVGAIPDVIKDGETGFITENNSPECIAKNIVRALAHPNVNEITKNARALVEEKYNYQAAVDGYRIILSSTF